MADHPKPSVEHAENPATESDAEKHEDGGPTAEQEHKLDEALDMSFPASDPIAI